jgi:Ca2+-binding RTX toxin-like protein
LNVAAAVTDTDGSETLALVASGIPVGATLSDGVNSFTATTGQTSVDISAWALTKLTITPSFNFTGDFPLTFTATTTDHATLSSGAVTDTRSVSQTIDVIVTPVAGSGSGISPAAALAGSNSNFVGSAGNDTLQGGSGNDVLTGGGGNDTYVFGRGGGQDRIVNGAPGNAGPSGELDFAAGIRTDQLWFQRDGNDLSIAVMGSQDKVTVADWFNTGASRLQEIKTADGSGIGSSLAQLVQAMATYSADHSGFDPAATAQAPNDPNLQHTIAASWHGSTG